MCYVELHQKPRSKASLSDEYETPKEVFDMLCEEYNMHPDTDVCATDDNSKCSGYVSEEMDCIKHNFQYHDEGLWCNPPHSMTKEFAKKMRDSWEEWDIPIMMIMPANAVTTRYAQEYLKDAEIHPIYGRITFLVNNNPAPFPARNGYFVVIWRPKYKRDKDGEIIR